MTDTAYLSNERRYTIFEYNGTRLKIIAPEPLVRYLKITDFDPKNRLYCCVDQLFVFSAT